MDKIKTDLATSFAIRLDDLQVQINAYSDYIMYNAENNKEFGKSWFPVCFGEFIMNEYVEYLEDTKDNENYIDFMEWYTKGDE